MEVLTLQSAIGNRAVSRLLAGGKAQRVQAKLKIGEPGDKYEQEADRVGHQVVRQMNAPASHSAGQGESVQREVMEDEELMMKPERVQLEAMENKNNLIQRKVYIKRNPLGRLRSQYRTKIKSQRSTQGETDRNVGDMMTDNLSRYFDSKDELFRYARKGTETIGYVNAEDTWIRLNSNQLLVLGENHTKTTLADIVKAVGTKKFMYEAYTEAPQELMGNEKFVKADNQRKEEFNQKFNTDNKGQFSHEAESFYPKVVRVLSDITCDPDTKSIINKAGPLGNYYLRLAILAAATSNHTNSQFYQHYQNNKNLFDKTANQLRTIPASETELSKQMEEQKSCEVLDIFLGAFTSYANEKVERERQNAASEDRGKFQERWHLREKGDFSSDENSPIMRGEKARDFSMYQHIKQARDRGYLLYGFGEVHRNRLKELLNQEGIQNKSMEEFLETQKIEYPQR
jgi:hypothetical protein